MANGIIPDKLHDFNVYSNANKLIGISGEVKLPELAAMSETLSGPGIMGEIDSPTPGFFSGMEQEIPFRTLYEDMFSLMSPLDAVDITRDPDHRHEQPPRRRGRARGGARAV